MHATRIGAYRNSCCHPAYADTGGFQPRDGNAYYYSCTNICSESNCHLWADAGPNSDSAIDSYTYGDANLDSNPYIGPNTYTYSLLDSSPYSGTNT